MNINLLFLYYFYMKIEQVFPPFNFIVVVFFLFRHLLQASFIFVCIL